MGKKGGSSTTVQSYQPTDEERALMKESLKYAQAVSPNALKLNDIAGELLYNSLGDTQVDYTSLMNNALSQVQTGQTGLNNLANGEIPAAYQTAMENSIKSGVQNSMGSLLSDLGNRGIINSSVMDTGLKGISDSASDAMAQQWNNTVSQLQSLYGSQIDSAGQQIVNASAAQEAAQQPALNLWNASLGLNGATTGALSAVGGKGTTTSTSSQSGGSGLFGGLVSAAASYYCFAPETKVTLADGSDVEIRRIQEGDKVRSPHIDGTETIETVAQVMKPHYSDCWNVVCKDGTETHVVSATLTQPVLTENGEFVELGALTLGTKIKGAGTVINLVYSGERKVYDLQISGDNTYYADGFIVKGGSLDVWGVTHGGE